jgi:myo-inositol-1(or 4)-monophosphatase
MGFTRGLSQIESAWLACFEEMGREGEQAVVRLVGRAEGRRCLGRGGGGDVTIELDRAAEEAMVGVLASAAPCRHTLIAEERGVVLCRDADWRVTLDPVDGSLNAKRGLEPYATTIAAADGETLGDVAVAYTRDYARGHRYAAVRGAGALIQWAGPAGPPEAMATDAPVEVVLLEGGAPHGQDARFRDVAHLAVPEPNPQLRVRQIGSLALSLCLVAVGVADVLVAPLSTRAVDIAGGLLILRECGGGAAALDGSELLDHPLDLARRAPFVAWRKGVDGSGVTTRARTYFGR